MKKKLAGQIDTLRKWDYRWRADSVATALAVMWGEELWQNVTAEARRQNVSQYEFMERRATPQQRIEALATVSDKLVADFGQWRTPWGSYKGSRKIYGTSGNSFLAIVEFGEKVSAMAVTAGGQSGDPKSPHFNDQAARYASGNLREVSFYPEQLKGHTERQYNPGN